MPSRPTSRAADTPIPTIPPPAGASSTTAARATGGCAPAPTTPTRSATTARRDLPSWDSAVPQWTTFSRYFAATWPRPIPTASTSTPRRPTASPTRPTLCTLPTIWDRLAAAGLSGRYYFSDVPFLALWGAKYIPISRPVDDVLQPTAPPARCPQVAFVDPRFEDEDSGTSGDDHPHADIRNGEAFMNSDLQRGHHEPELVAHGPASSTSTSGAASSTTSRRPPRRSHRGRRGRQHRRPARLPRPVPHGLAVARRAHVAQPPSTTTPRCCA